jgi:hypothetical protein
MKSTRCTRTWRNLWLTLSLTVTLVWTNPALNADGTPCRDLAAIIVDAVRESDGLKITGILDLCQVDDHGDVACRSYAGARDSTVMALPERYGVDWWHFNVAGIDSTGNRADPSNTVRVDLGKAGTPTGVPPLVDASPTRDVEWYDVQGRRIPPISSSTPSGVYFRRRGDVVTRVVVIK